MNLAEEYKEKKEAKLKEWEQLKKSEEAKTYGLDREPIIVTAFENWLNAMDVPPTNLIHEYITFSIGFHTAVRIMNEATGGY